MCHVCPQELCERPRSGVCHVCPQELCERPRSGVTGSQPAAASPAALRLRRRPASGQSPPQPAAAAARSAKPASRPVQTDEQIDRRAASLAVKESPPQSTGAAEMVATAREKKETPTLTEPTGVQNETGARACQSDICVERSRRQPLQSGSETRDSLRLEPPEASEDRRSSVSTGQQVSEQSLAEWCEVYWDSSEGKRRMLPQIVSKYNSGYKKEMVCSRPTQTFTMKSDAHFCFRNL